MGWAPGSPRNARAEVHHILATSGLRPETAAFLADVAGGGYELVHHSDADYEKAGQLIARYAGQMRRKRRKPGSLDLADAMNVVVAGDKGTNLLLTADADYRVVAPLTAHAAFLLLPADLAP